ncbi:M48 family metallopeptidase [Kibdelosporangium aridum]|uniref:M48 family metallopeptidase n=1 Tax=Kibdelosporangium aridum TaxID=2030 RepID=UPI0035EA6C86
MNDPPVESQTRDPPEPDGRAWTPTGTTVRFALLVALVMGATLFVHARVAPPGPVYWLDVSLQCEKSVNLTPLPPSDVPLTPGEQREIDQRRMEDCLGQHLPQRLGWMIGGQLGLLLLAAALYQVQPRWRIRRLRLVPLDVAAAPELAAELDLLVDRAGLKRRPVFLIDPVSPRTGGLAFGSGRKGYVALDAGLVTLHRTDRRSFRAVVLHELAHLRNGDVRITYLTMAVWRTFLVIGLLPLLIASIDPWLFSPDPLTPLSGYWSAEYAEWFVEASLQFLALVALVYLSRNAVLRAREQHADARVSAWLGSVDPRECFPAATGRKHPRWTGWWRTHPSPQARVAALGAPAQLLRPGFWESVLAGIALKSATTQVGLALQLVTAESADARTLVGRIWGLGMAVFIVVTGLRLAAFCRETAASVWRTAIAPTAGVVAGTLLALNRTAVGYLPQLLPSIATLVGALVLASIVLAALCWMSWCAALAEHAPVARRTTARLAAAATIALVGVSLLHLWGWRSMDSYARNIGIALRATENYLRDGAWTGADVVLNRVVQHPVLALAGGSLPLLASLTLIWLIPLWLQRFGSSRQIRRATITALLGALIWLAGDLLVRVFARWTALPENRHTVVFARVFLDREVALLLIVQFMVTLVLIVRGRGLAVSLFGGAATAVFVILLQWALWSFEGCLPFLQTFYTACPTPQPAFGGGQLMRASVRGMIVMLAGAGVGAAIVRLRSQDQPVVSGHAPVRSGTRRFAAATVAVVAVVSVSVPALRPRSTQLSGLGEAIVAEDNAQPSASPRDVHRAWLRSGGASHIKEVGDAYRTVLAEIDNLANTNSADVSKLVPPLQALTDAASRASSFPGPPGERSQIWQTELAKVERACRTLIEASAAGARSFTAVLRQAAKDLIDGVIEVENLVHTP